MNPIQKCQNLKKFMQNIRAKVEHTFFYSHIKLTQTFISEDYEGNDLKLITIWELKNQPQNLWIEMNFDLDLWIFCFQGYFTLNNIPIKIDPHYTKITSIRLFENLNTFLSKSSDFIQYDFNPKTGLASVLYKFLMSPSDVEWHIQNFKMSQNIQKSLSEMLFNSEILLKVIELLRKCSGSFPKQIYQGKRKQQNKAQSIKKLLQMISKQISPNIDEIENLSNYQEKLKYFAKYYQQFSPQVKNLIEKISESPNQNLDYQNCFEKTINQVLSQNEMSGSSSEYSEFRSLVKQIKILTKSPKWQIFAKGGNGIIQKAQIQYQLLPLEGDYQKEETFSKVCQGIILRKQNKNEQKTQKQIEIINYFRHQYHPNILPCYLSKSVEGKKYIYFKHHFHKSLEAYLRTNQQTISLLTVLRLLEHIARGLIFLQHKQIIHFDIKPHNVIVTKMLIAKIIDFGQSLYLPNFHKCINFGITIPYAPFEVFSEKYDFLASSKIDIFSFGVTIHFVLFGKHIWGNLRQIKQFRKKYKSNSLKKILVPQLFQKMGFAFILRMMQFLTLKAISPENKYRPSLDYMFFFIFLAKKYVKQVSHPIRFLINQ